jgi:hypothetical protein
VHRQLPGEWRRVYEHYPGCNRDVVWIYRSNSWLGFAVFQKGAGRKQNQAVGAGVPNLDSALVVFLAGCAIFILPPVIHMPNDTLISFQWPGVAGTTTTINGSTQLPFPTDRDHPLKLRSNEIRGSGLDKQTVRYYFSFVGGPGEVKLTFDFGPHAYYQSGEVNLYDEDFEKIDGLHSAQNERLIKHIQIDPQRNLILEVLLNSGELSPPAATFFVRVDGAVRFQ